MTARTCSPPTRSLPAATSSRSPSACQWDEAYPASNVAFSVPADGVVTTITYKAVDARGHGQDLKAGAAPDLTKAKAYVVGPDLVAWPASALPAGTDPATLRWRLHWSADGGLAVDAEAVTGGSVASLTRDPAGLPASLVAAHPELEGAVALRLDKATAEQLPEILKGQVAVAMYDTTGRLLDATGAQTAIAARRPVRAPRPAAAPMASASPVAAGRLHASGPRPPSR